jgi:hypothetical protein
MLSDNTTPTPTKIVRSVKTLIKVQRGALPCIFTGYTILLLFWERLFLPNETIHAIAGTVCVCVCLTVCVCVCVRSGPLLYMVQIMILRDFTRFVVITVCVMLRVI